MSDMINRQDAIDALTEYGDGRNLYMSVGELKRRIEQLPSAEPQQRKTGKWIDCVNSEHWKCSNCGCRSAYWFNEDGLAEWLSDYCPNCGADMRGMTT